MKAAIVENLGQPPRFGVFEDPVAAVGEDVVEVLAASLKQLDRAIVAGTHYSSPKMLPIVAGTDGVGRTADGATAYFWSGRRPFGAMAERAPAAWSVPLPAGLDVATAAAIVNPGLAAWLPLVWRGGLQPGETVLILGATGASGGLAVKAARLLGAGRVVAAGRRQDVLAGLGADATIDLTLPPDALRAAFAETAVQGLGVVVDYVWGPAVEALIAVLTQHDLSSSADGPGVRLVSVGAMAGPAIAMPSAALRGSRLTITGSGTGNFPPVDRMKAIVATILDHAAAGDIGLAVDRRPLADVAEAWSEPGDPDRRIVLMR